MLHFGTHKSFALMAKPGTASECCPKEKSGIQKRDKSEFVVAFDNRPSIEGDGLPRDTARASIVTSTPRTSIKT